MIDYQREYSVLTAKQRLGSIIDAAVQGKVSKIRHGTRVAYVIPIEMYEAVQTLLRKAEELKEPQEPQPVKLKEAPKPTPAKLSPITDDGSDHEEPKEPPKEETDTD